MRPLGIGKKQPAYKDPAVDWLMRLSKAALCDCVVDLLRMQQDSADDPVSAATAARVLEPILAHRGDRLPKLYHQL